MLPFCSGSRALRLLALGTALPLLAPLAAQQAPLLGHWQDVPLRSGIHANPTPVAGVVWRDFVLLQDGSPWVRLYFGDANLEGDSQLRIVSLRDGDVQLLDRKSLEQWANSTAYFNGDALMIELVAGPNTQKNFVEVSKVFAGDLAAEVPPPESICGTTDNRVPSSDPRAGRILGVGCSGWIISTATSNPNERLHLSAGHCFATGQVLQFNVPASSTSCALVMPSASFQFSIDSASGSLSNNGGIGNDWWVFKCFPNSNTGLTTFQAMGQAFSLATTLPAPGATLVNWGYGVDGTPANNGANSGSCGCASPNGARNQTQQTHTGPFSSATGTSVFHQIDTCGGNSGSVVALNSTGVAIAIHTNAGCSSTGGNNSGTSVLNTGLQAAITALAGGNTTPPANDACANPIALVRGLNGPYSSLFATAGSAFACVPQGGSDVWFTYTALATGSHTFDTCSTTRNFDTTLEVFSGTCAALTSIGCNDDSCALGSSVTANLTAGQTYRVHVGGYNNATGAFDVNVTAPNVAGDECTAPIPIALGANGIFSNVGATASTTAPAWTCGFGSPLDVWFSFTANCTAPTTFTTCPLGRTVDTMVSIYSGTCASPVLLGCNDDSCGLGSQLTVNLVSGQTYLVRVGGYNGAVGSFWLTAECGTGTGTMTQLPMACGSANLTVSGQPHILGTLQCTITNATGLPFLGYGFNLAQTPFCGCTFGHDWAEALFGVSNSLTIPCDPFFIGLQFGLQGLDFGSTSGCASPALSTTDTVIITIG